jgi:hypothetical protein
MVTENVDMSIEGDLLTIKIRLNVAGRRSKDRYGAKGKNVVLASTLGTKPLIGQDGKYREEMINLSVWRAPKRGE